MRLSKPHLTVPQKQRILEFSSWILSVGNGELGTPDIDDPTNTRWVHILDRFCIPDNENGLANLISFIYLHETLQKPTASELQQKAIVCPKNDAVDSINKLVVDMVEGSVITYSSSDSATPHGNDGGESEMLYPAEYLNTLNYPGLPPHLLELKIGIPAILLRNINIAGAYATALE
ncbi:uncharacterized protein [Rutidosis leptorrhynchoides]|uniref:uncharacterized protein n=1 Tax=Rutidosis leptorrhynchoides TaxID=125765 RepID=UPI003A99D23C